jgi:hypothetical protein
LELQIDGNPQEKDSRQTKEAQTLPAQAHLALYPVCPSLVLGNHRILLSAIQLGKSASYPIDGLKMGRARI